MSNSNPAITQSPGSAPYYSDDTRSWVEAYRVNGKIKPSFVLRVATDSNWINNQFIGLPAYGGRPVYCQAISNIMSPGQRIGGVLSWQATESLDNITQAAVLTVLDALPVSAISTTATNYLVGTGSPQFIDSGYNTASNVVNGPTGVTAASSIYGSNTMPAQWFSPIIRYQWVQNGLGISVQLVGNIPIGNYYDPSLAQNDPNTTRQYQEENLIYRQFEPEVIQVSSLSQFPNPAVPAAENEAAFSQLGGQYSPTNSGAEWWDVDYNGALHGVGAFYILVDQEVMRVTRVDLANNYLFIPPGGRGVAGTVTAHAPGAAVTLLGFPPFTGQWAGMGYLMPSDYGVNQSPMRPGTCFVSYEGYGNPGNYTNPNGTGPFAPKNLTNPFVAPFGSKQFDRNNNMCFTGWWFSESPEISLDDTGVPQLTVNMQSSGHLLAEQTIDPNNISRAKNMFYSWSLATFDAIGYNRKMPGDWYDFNMWDPTLPGSYPLTISTEYAQHQAFFNHMQDTNNGTTCQYCQAEWWQYVQQHEGGQPTGSIAESRQVGKHIYYESIRVYNLGGQFNSGPLKTYGRLMHALAMAAWDNPQIGDTLGSRWTKIPNLLFDNMKNFINGRVWNGQLAYDFPGSATFDYFNSPYSDIWVNGNRIPLHSPFTSQYDRQPWSQAMTDLSAMNRMSYGLSREGYPIFIPIGKKLRGIPNPALSSKPGYTGPHIPFGQFLDGAGNECSDNDIGLGEWHLSYGGSIDNYTHTIDPSGVLTLVYVSCQTAFGDEITFTIPAAGTGIGVHYNAFGQQTSEQILQYSNSVGNKEGLQLTSGAQQTDAVSLDNLLLGLDWNTQPASWGLTVIRGGDQVLQVNAQPPIPNPGANRIYYESDDARTHSGLVTKVEKCCNFFIQRRYIGAPTYDQYGIVYYVSGFLTEGGKFTGAEGLALKDALSKLQGFLAGQSVASMGGGDLNLTSGKYVYTTASGVNVAGDPPGAYGQSTFQAVRAWINNSSEYIKTDIWWYVENGSSWDEYVAAIVGLDIPQIPSNSGGDGSSTLWQIDQNALAVQADAWLTRFYQDAITYGNSIVDDSINKATQKVINTNLADPRIQLGDVIWADIPGYLSADNTFGQKVSPFTNGVYITGITRSLDLQQGTYSASYSGYRYRGNFESNVTTNVSNYSSTSMGI